MPRTVAGLWIGKRLNQLEQVCIQSFLDFGHRFVLYGYDQIENAPVGTELLDAREIFDCGRILRYGGNGSPALHANLFRYQMCAKTDFIWVDLDILALQPFDMTDEFVFGWQDGASVNNAVLALPDHSRTLAHLLKYDSDSFGFPPSLARNRKLERWVKSIFRRSPITEWPWGSTGPRMLSHYARKTGEIAHAAPTETYYPVSFNDTGRLLEPGAVDLEDFGPHVMCVHFWAKRFRQISGRDYGGVIPAGSCFAQAVARHPYRTTE